MIIDFELAVKRALLTTFGLKTDVRFCFYHLTQSTWHKIQELGLVQNFCDNEEFRHFCGMIDGLAFLPPDQIANGMLHLRNMVPNQAVPCLDYFNTTYVTCCFRRGAAQPYGVIRVRRLRPAFPPASWNVHEATMTGDPRTNMFARDGITNIDI